MGRYSFDVELSHLLLQAGLSRRTVRPRQLLLKSLKRLTKLDLTGTPVTDLTPLAELPNLTWLGLSEATPATAAQRSMLMKRLPGLRIGVGRRY